MINCHFVDVLKTFHTDELIHFRNYIDSPYFNKRKKLVELYDIIKDYYPFFTDENFCRETVFHKLYPNEVYNYAKINEGLSSLYKLSLSYIKQISFEQNDVYGDVMFLEELRKRSLKQIFTLKSKDLDKSLDTLSNLDSDLFLKQYLVEIEKSNFIYLFGKKSRKEKIQSFLTQLNRNITSLTNFYVAEIIALSVSNFNFSHAFENFGNTVFVNFREKNLISQLFEVIKPYNKYNSYLSLLNLYFEAINDITNNERYYDYKNKVFQFQQSMSADDLNYHMNCLKAYCVIKNRDSKYRDEFSKEYIHLQEITLQKKLFIDSKTQFFLKEQFLNLLINYDIMKDKNKIKLLLNYVKYLHPDSRENLQYLTEAHYYFLNFSFDKVFSCLKKINVPDKTFEEKINNLEVRSLYEMNNFIECLEKITLYKKQRRANKYTSKMRTESQLLFLSALEKLVKIKEKNSSLDAEFLKNQIEKNSTIPCKEWLLEKCYELYEKPKQAYTY